jgi:MTH538 TIR-like domain (DUF1863)
MGGTFVSHRDRTYVVFDGDEDIWAYGYMKGWRANENVDFDFVDAHDLNPLTALATDEPYIKAVLRDRLKASKQVVVLVGENTKNLYKFVRWEIEVALELQLPIIVVNLNDRRALDADRCPAILRDEDVVHIAFKLAIIRYALDRFPGERRGRGNQNGGPRFYDNDLYTQLGL